MQQDSADYIDGQGQSSVMSNHTYNPPGMISQAKVKMTKKLKLKILDDALKLLLSYFMIKYNQLVFDQSIL